jgi:hypothetical protein
LTATIGSSSEPVGLQREHLPRIDLQDLDRDDRLVVGLCEHGVPAPRTELGLQRLLDLRADRGRHGV